MALSVEKASSIGHFNVGLAVAAGFLSPLSAQIDALIAVGIGPLQFDLAAQFNASLALQATLTLQVGDPLSALKLAISALAQLQAALAFSLQFPAPALSLQLGASVALAAALSARLGTISIALQIALAIKLGALQFLASLELGVGPLFALEFDGDALSTTGGLVQARFAGGLVDGAESIAAGEVVSGFIFLTKTPSVFAALSAIMSAV